jgi:glycosyltransferase involved in cell wall biosynthesis
LKILFICQYYKPEQFNINIICEELLKYDHEVTVITGLPNYPEGKIPSKYRFFRNRNEKVEGVTVKRCWLIGRGKGRIKLILNYFSFALSASCKVLFMRKDYDLVFIYQLSPVTMAIPAVLYKILTGKPLFLYCFDLWPESLISGGVLQKSIVYGMALILTRWIYRHIDRLLISSSQFEKYIIDVIRYMKEIYYLPMFSADIFKNVKERENGVTDFVFAGNIGVMQSVETIVFAANEIKDRDDIIIHIVGDGSSRQSCEKLAHDLRLSNIVFHGRYPIAKMPDFYELADAFLITLKKNDIISYTLPNKMQSYMAAGKPIIGAIDGETAKIISESQCGICTPAEDFMKLAESMIMFTKNKENNFKYGDNAKKYYIQNFTFEKFMYNLNIHLKNI